RLRVLHPLSYVEDPTRLFRAARYATRFGLAPDAATARAQTLALRLAPYAALSGQRIVAELERILVEPHAAETLARLGRGGAFRAAPASPRSEEHTSELQSRFDLVCRLLLEKKKQKNIIRITATKR